MQKLEMKAIHENSLDVFLEKLGIYDKFSKGELTCSVCGDKIVVDNLGAIQSVKGTTRLICNKAKCYGKISQQILSRE